MHLLITPSMASLSPLNIIAAPPKATNEGTLDQRFGRKGVKFNDDSGEVELTVRNGSSLKLHVSNGHITSYRPKVYWKDDGFEEVLHTDAGSRGGLGLVIMNNEEKEDKRMGASSSSSSSSSSSQWTVKDVDSDSIDALQVELRCTRGSLDISYVVSLYPLSMATAVIVKNNGVKAVDLSSAILGHFKFKKRGGTGIQGLRGSSYCTHPPLPSPFQILSPAEAVKPDDHPPGLFSFSFGWEPEKEPGVWCVQEDPMTILKHKLSRVYAAPPSERSNGFHRSAPSKYETLDQGRELFFRVIRMGYEEIYLSSPGASYDKYGKEYYICTGPASMLVPVTVNPGEEWRGAQVIEHDNL